MKTTQHVSVTLLYNAVVQRKIPINLVEIPLGFLTYLVLFHIAYAFSSLSSLLQFCMSVSPLPVICLHFYSLKI